MLTGVLAKKEGSNAEYIMRLPQHMETMTLKNFFKLYYDVDIVTGPASNSDPNTNPESLDTHS